MLFDETLMFGVAVDSPYLGKEIHQHFTLPADRSANVQADQSMMMSH